MSTRKTPKESIDDRYRAKARKMYTGHGGQFCDGDIDMDDHPKVSKSTAGAYVAAWVWVTRDEIEEDAE